MYEIIVEKMLECDEYNEWKYFEMVKRPHFTQNNLQVQDFKNIRNLKALFYDMSSFQVDLPKLNLT
jgi:hypothetical protein